MSLSGELPAGAATAAIAATAAEEKPILSLFDKLRGKRRTSVDSSMVPKASAHRLSLDGGTNTVSNCFPAAVLSLQVLHAVPVWIAAALVVLLHQNLDLLGYGTCNEI